MHAVDWALPPSMKFVKQQNWCGQKDLIRLHALGHWRETCWIVEPGWSGDQNVFQESMFMAQAPSSSRPSCPFCSETVLKDLTAMMLWHTLTMTLNSRETSPQFLDVLLQARKEMMQL